MIYEFNGMIPYVHETAFVHPQACVMGAVNIGRNVYVGPSAVIRGDWGEIIIEDGCNIQENCTVHIFPGLSILLEEGAHIGHGAIVHGANIGKNVLVGMNAVIMDDAEVGRDSIIGALSFVKAGMKIPPRSLVVGNPAKIVKEVSDEMIAWKTQGTKLYQELPLQMQESLKICQPLTQPQSRPQLNAIYQRWKGDQKR